MIAGTEITIEGAFETVTRGPGKSCLDAIVYHHERTKRDLLRLRLEVNLEQDDRSPRVYEFCVCPNRWQNMVNQSGWAWTQNLNELITRSTDRAYYHVHNRLTCDFGEEFAVGEEARWGAGWGMRSLREQERRETTVDDISKLLEDASV